MEAYKITHVGMDRILLWQKFGAITFIANNACVDDDGLVLPGADSITQTSSLRHGR